MKQAHIEWQQGQPVSTVFDDVYFSREGGVEETEYVFLQNNGLPERWQGRDHFVIAETGFGTGLNFLTTVQAWLQSTDEQSRLHYISAEKFPLSRDDLHRALSVWPEFEPYSTELIQAYPPAVEGYHQLNLFDHRVSLTLMLGEAETMFEQLDARVDAWYLDGFAPGKNPDMWTQDLFQQMARLSHEDTRFSTFTAAGFVRRGLEAAGFSVNKVKGFGQKREMLAGVMTATASSGQNQPWFQVPEFTPATKRVAVVGAGIAGVTTAWALANRGWQVELIDKQDDLAQEGSGNPAGVILPRISLDHSAEAEFYNSAYFHALRELEKTSVDDTTHNWQMSGVIQLASSERIKKQIKQLDVPAELAHAISAERASDISGMTITDEALYYPRAGWLCPQQLCRLLLEQASDRITVHYHRELSRLESVHNRWQLHDVEDGVICETDAVVLANANGVKNIKQTAWLAVEAVRGQISYLPATTRSQQIHTPICYEGYILPQRDGQHVMGATFKPGQDSIAVNLPEHEENLAQLEHWLPDITTVDAASLHGRAALRAVASDRMPLVGAVVDIAHFKNTYADLQKGKPASQYPPAICYAGLYVNVGHGARGLTSCFLSADLIAAQLNNEPLPVSRRVQYALNPTRFMVRALKKGQLVKNENNNNTTDDLSGHKCTGGL